MPESALRLYRWDGEQWTTQGVSSAVDVEQNQVVAHVDHLSRFAVLAEWTRIFLPAILKH